MLSNFLESNFFFQEPLLGHGGRKVRKGSLSRSYQIISKRPSYELHLNQETNQKPKKMQPPDLCRNIMGDWGKNLSNIESIITESKL